MASSSLLDDSASSQLSADRLTAAVDKLEQLVLRQIDQFDVEAVVGALVEEIDSGVIDQPATNQSPAISSELKSATPETPKSEPSLLAGGAPIKRTPRRKKIDANPLPLPDQPSLF